MSAAEDALLKLETAAMSHATAPMPLKLWAHHDRLIGRTISRVQQDDDFILLYFADGGYVCLRQNVEHLAEQFHADEKPKVLLSLKTWDIEDYEPRDAPVHISVPLHAELDALAERLRDDADGDRLGVEERPDRFEQE